MQSQRQHYYSRRRRADAFTLAEVMIAVAIFTMAMFAILGVLSTNLHAAGILRKSGPTAGMVAGQLSLTNKMEEGMLSGDFGEIYEGWKWQALTSEAATNGLFKVEIAVRDKDGRIDSELSVLFYRPDSQSHMGLH